MKLFYNFRKAVSLNEAQYCKHTLASYIFQHSYFFWCRWCTCRTHMLQCLCVRMCACQCHNTQEPKTTLNSAGHPWDIHLITSPRSQKFTSKLPGKRSRHFWGITKRVSESNNIVFNPTQFCLIPEWEQQAKGDLQRKQINAPADGCVLATHNRIKCQEFIYNYNMTHYLNYALLSRSLSWKNTKDFSWDKV